MFIVEAPNSIHYLTIYFSCLATEYVAVKSYCGATLCEWQNCYRHGYIYQRRTRELSIRELAIKIKVDHYL